METVPGKMAMVGNSLLLAVGRVHTQKIGVVAILIAGGNLVDSLTNRGVGDRPESHV